MTAGMPPNLVPLPVVDDYGEVGKGASKAHTVLAENGEDYIIKGPAFVPEHPTVAANEWIAAQLADALGLPVLDYRIVSMRGDLFFASAWMQKPTFLPAIDAETFKKCENRNRAYGVVVFDCWLVNRDRHNENLIVRTSRQGNRLMILNDHSHLLVSPSEPKKMSELQASIEAPPAPFVWLPFLRDAITDPGEVRLVLDQIEALSEDFIRSVVGGTPEQLLSGTDQTIYADFLVERKSCLREVMQTGSSVFPKLEGSI